MHEELEKNYNLVKHRIKEAGGGVELIAVSKKHPIEAIEFISSLGQEKFGENYPSELFEKVQKTKNPNIKWVFIGTLQSNKIQRLVECCDEIQTVSSLKHLRYVDRYAKELGKKGFPVYLQININEEPQKSGFLASELQSCIDEIKTFENIEIKGLMAIPSSEDSHSSNKGHLPASYSKLSELNNSFGYKHLSLGMSADLEAAVKAGSTCVRIGTDIFGKRAY